MTGQIPKYGKNFSLQHLPYEFGKDLASRAYVLKRNKSYRIRSTRNSEHWTIYVAGPSDAWFPVGPEHDTLTEAMAYLLSKAAEWCIEDKSDEYSKNQE